MDDLVTWLHARLDEDERIARAVEDRSAPWDGQWMADGNSAVRTFNGHVLFYRHDSGPLKPGLADYVAAHDPARVLREIDAKRQMADLHSPTPGYVGADEDDEPACRMCGDLTVRFPCRTLRLLALPYANHPDYREAWRP